MTQPDLNLPRVAYETYLEAAGGKSLATGSPLPPWEDLPLRIREAWAMAAAATVARMFSHIRDPMRKCGQCLAESNQELREACTHAASGEWDADYPTERLTHDERQMAAMAILDAVAILDQACTP